jgi:hypothetical protein
MWTDKRILVAALALAPLVGLGVYLLFRFPPDTTPEGAYMRISYAISRGDPRASFAYLEEEAQHSAYSIGDYAEQAATRIQESYPEPERSRALERYGWALEASEGMDVWARLAAERGWIERLRRDLSGIAEVSIAGERATVVTVRGTRYPFRRRPNGIWGLTLFTVELEAEAEHLARDWERIQRAAEDYARAAADDPAGAVSRPSP